MNDNSGADTRISVLTEDLRRQIDNTVKSGGLCLARFKADVLLRDVKAEDVRPGFRFVVDGATYEVTDERKKCHAECPLAANKTPCCLAGSYVFAVILNPMTEASFSRSSS
jgi:hypothetical protein